MHTVIVYYFASNFPLMLTKDKLWKAVFEDFFPEAILFFFPFFYPLIDWARGFEILDKELKELFNDSEGNERHADLLVKVWLLDGTEQWLLFHIEIQGYFDKDFPRRMFIYYYRLTDRYDVPIAALALLTDTDKGWRPDHYSTRCLGTELRYAYTLFKLSDYKPEELDLSNPLAIVMKTALLSLESNKDDDLLLTQKTALYRDLRNAGHSAEKVRSMYQFIKYYVHFGKKNYFPKFDNEIRKLDHDKTKTMGLIELVKEHLLEEAKEEGMEKGMEKGQLKQAITGLRNMEKKGFAAGDAASILDVPESLAIQIYSQLKKETQILETLRTSQLDIDEIAGQLDVFPMLVQVIYDAAK